MNYGYGGRERTGYEDDIEGTRESGIPALNGASVAQMDRHDTQEFNKRLIDNARARRSERLAEHRALLRRIKENNGLDKLPDIPFEEVRARRAPNGDIINWLW